VPPDPTGAAITALLAPASVAIVGASPRSYVGRVLCENLVTLGYSGRVYPVNPRYEEVLGWKCLPSLQALTEPPEAVAVAVSFDLVPEFLRAAGELGVRAAMVPGGGFTETGLEALRIQDDIAAVAEQYEMAVCGPNCMGVIRPGSGSALYIGTIPPSLLSGRVALVSQSGSVVEAAVNMGPRIGFSALVSCGNEAVTTVGQYLRFFAGDDATSAVALFLEGFRDPTGFVEGARSLREAGKPLAVLQAGRSHHAAAAIAAHSGTLAGTEEVVTGLLNQLGAIGVDDLDELFEVAELLGHGRLPAGRRMFAVTDSGGEANLIIDHATRIGLELPPPSAGLVHRVRSRWPNFSFLGNPIDPWGVDSDYWTLYGEILEAASAEDVDVVAVALDKVTTWAGQNEVDLGVAAATALIAAMTGSAKLPAFFTIHATGAAAGAVREPLRAASVPLMHGLRPALAAIGHAWWWQQWSPRSPRPDHFPPIALPEISEPGPVLSERASREILAACGIPQVRAEVAESPTEAAASAKRVGFPVVMKADVPGMAHKAAAGLVMTGVSSQQAARKAFESLTARIPAVTTETRSVLVEATASGVELICGMRRDPVFGPVVLLGVGGTMTEVIQEVAVRVCPVALEDLEEMIEESPVGRLVAAAGADPHAVQAVAGALADLALDHPEIEEVDINPLFAGRGGVVAADALVVMGSDGKG
jgi:acyl-CoA synthetase (NDP forming)